MVEWKSAKKSGIRGEKKETAWNYFFANIHQLIFYF
jgi:hypothetical protein